MNTLSIAVFAAVAAVASAGLLGAPLAAPVYQQAVHAVPAATYSTYGGRIRKYARPVAYQQAIAAPVAYQQAIAAPVYQQAVHAVPAATYSTYGGRISQSARPVAYAAAPVAQVAYAQQAIAAPVGLGYGVARGVVGGVATTGLGYNGINSIGYGYNGAIASTLLH